MSNLIAFPSRPGAELGNFVPPNWEKLSSYTGDQRYVGVYWEPEHAVVMMDDGVMQRVSDGVWVALLYNHAYSMGACQDKRPEKDGHWFVVDREERKLLWMKSKQALSLMKKANSTPADVVSAVISSAERMKEFSDRDRAVRASIKVADDWFRSKLGEKN